MSRAANIKHVTRAWNRYEARESMHGGRGWGGGEATIGDKLLKVNHTGLVSDIRH